MVMQLANRVRRSGSNPALKEERGLWNWGRQPATHTTVDDMSALSLTAFYRGVTLIASTIASLPLHVYQDDDDGEKEKIKTLDTAYLWRRPNIEMTRQAMWERVFADEVRGNGFVFVQKDDDGQPESIWYLDRRRVRVGRNSDGMKVYEVDNLLPMIDYKQGGEIVHIPNWGDGLVGFDPVALAQQALALGLSAEEYAARTFSQGETPPGLITTDSTLTREQADALSARWTALHGGTRNAHKIAVLGNGAKFQQTSVDMDKMQMESLRRFQVQEVARLLGLPPHLLADVANSTSWGTGIEEQNRGLITFTLQAHITRVEQAIDDALLVNELTQRYVKLDLRGLLRGSTLQRFQAYRAADFMSKNEKRGLEDLPAYDGGDTLYEAVNMAPVGPKDENAEAAVAAVGDVQQLALNGAQIASLLEVVTQVTAGQLSPETAKAVMEVSFPALTEAQINRIVDSAAAFNAAKQEPAPEGDE